MYMYVRLYVRVHVYTLMRASVYGCFKVKVVCLSSKEEATDSRRLRTGSVERGNLKTRQKSLALARSLRDKEEEMRWVIPIATRM